jgi:hypothetical protein
VSVGVLEGEKVAPVSVSGTEKVCGAVSDSDMLFAVPLREFDSVG